jgi:D-alanine-D-alanine ligase
MQLSDTHMRVTRYFLISNMLKKKNILVLMGGKSPEHEISLISGSQVVKNLNHKKYQILPGVISKDGKKLQLISPLKLLQQKDPLLIKGTDKDLIINPDREVSGVNGLTDPIDVVFIAMHGPFGEDGTVQGMLELAGLKYTGSGVLPSALGMDKIAFRQFLKSEKVNIPDYIIIEKNENYIKKVKKLGKPPYFVKPFNQGSSVGNSIVKSNKDLGKALNTAFKYSEKVLVDKYIYGKEVTVGLLGNNNPEALPVVEIIPLKGEYFDYDSKYTESGAKEIVPAGISKSLTKKVQEIAIKVHKVLGCKGFSRVDFILKDNKTPFVLEINTIPGLTPMSLLPKAAKAAGISYSELLDKIIKYAEHNS